MTAIGEIMLGICLAWSVGLGALALLDANL